MKYCSKCGSALTDDAVFCSTCGNKVGGSQAAPTPAPAPVQQTTVVQVNTQQPKKKNAADVLGIFGLIFSILALLLTFVGAVISVIPFVGPIIGMTPAYISLAFWPFSFIVSIIGIKKATGRGKCVAGLVMSIISILLFVVPIIMFAVEMGALNNYVNGYSSSYNDGYGYYLALASLL